MALPMKRIVWATDIHLNFVRDAKSLAFFESIAKQNPDAVLIGGDIAEAHNFERYLIDMCHIVNRPVYFVLGNHDYYKSSIAQVRARTRQLCQRVPNLVWLSNCDEIELTKDTCLLGHDGWADARIPRRPAGTSPGL